MPRGRFVLRYRGEGAKPEAEVDRILNLPEVEVLDASSPRMLLVEADDEPLRRLLESLPGWVMATEKAIRVPDTRKKVLRPPA